MNVFTNTRLTDSYFSTTDRTSPFDKIQVTVCVAFEDGTSKTQTIAIAAAASDANSTYEKGQTQKEKLIQYEMR